VAEIGVPVNIAAGPGGLGRSDLAALGVARVSFGGGLAHAAYDAAAAQVEDFLAR
jgi:2-methylisocitrate lyase-like PEP mutase family enzyme